MALSKGSILKHAGVFKAREVHVPAWADESGDDVVLVRGLTVREYELNQSRASDGKATASIISRCIVDADGGRVFADADVDVIAELPMGQIAEVSKAILEESGLAEDVEPSKVAEASITEAGKDSAPTGGGEPSSA